jgi:hypothetical protein
MTKHDIYLNFMKIESFMTVVSSVLLKCELENKDKQKIISCLSDFSNSLQVLEKKHLRSNHEMEKTL